MKYTCHMSAMSSHVKRIAARIDEVVPLDQARGHCTGKSGIPHVNPGVQDRDADPAYRWISTQCPQDMLAVCIQS